MFLRFSSKNNNYYRIAEILQEKKRRLSFLTLNICKKESNVSVFFCNFAPLKSSIYDIRLIIRQLRTI